MNEYVLFIGALILLSLDIQDNFQFQISNLFFGSFSSGILYVAL